jgi:hypothetical protein
LPPLFFVALFPVFSTFSPLSLFFELENGGMMSEPSEVVDEDAALVCAGGSVSFSAALPAGSGVADPDRGGSPTAVVGLSGGRAGPPHAKRLVHVTMKMAPTEERQKNACIVGDLYESPTTQEAR